MSGVIEYWDYIALAILIVVTLFLVAFAAARQTKQPLVVFAGLLASWFIPLLLPLYLGVLFFAAKKSRLYIYTLLVLICLVLLNVASSGLSKKIKFEDVYSGNAVIKEGRTVSIKGDFIEMHENRYMVTKTNKIGGTEYNSRHFYYEIIPVDVEETRSVRVFVYDLDLYRQPMPSSNQAGSGRFVGYGYIRDFVDESVLAAINSTLSPGQSVVFLSEYSDATYESKQFDAMLGSLIFGTLAAIFSLLAYRRFKAG